MSAKPKLATLIAAAQSYLNNHHYVPLRLQGKSPEIPMGKGWQKRKLTDGIPSFEAGDNIGFLLGTPSGGVVRLDPDFQSIPAVAKTLFPEPTLMFGRESSPRSGRLFVCKDFKSKKFTLPSSVKGDPRLPVHNGKPGLVVYEILGTGKQTMCPPSIHPDSGEELVWQSPGNATIKTLAADELLRRTGIEAFLLAVRNFWPPQGTRNEAAMALARVLLEALETHCSDDEERISIVDELVVEVAMAGGDGPCSRDGKERAATTLEKMRAGEETTGLTRLVELLELPKDVVKKFRQWLGTAREVVGGASLPTIQVYSGKIALAVDATETALRNANQPVFVRAGNLVQPIWSEVPVAGGGMTQITVLKSITVSNLAYMLTKHAATFVKWNDHKKELVPIDPPENVLRGLLERGYWKFPRVTGIVNAPTLRGDGSILDRPGYDPATQLWCWPDENLKMPPIPLRPTKEDGLAALASLKELLEEFPFVDKRLDLSVALAAILTAVLRGAFDVALLFLFVAHSAGTGKSYLVNLISTIIRGRPCPVTTASRSLEEMEKRLGALLLEGIPIVSLDNLTTDLESDLLCQMTEQPLVKVRVLGRSEMPECEWRGCAFGTGNNVTLKGDMVRRGLRCNLDAGLEEPENRVFSSDPIVRVLKDRGHYIAAALIVARACLVAKDQPTCTPLASYGGWSRFVREPLIWLGENDPVKSMEQTRAEDPERNAARGLIEQWKTHLGTEKDYSVGEIIEFARERLPADRLGNSMPNELARPEFHGLLMEKCPGRGEIDALRLGHWLKKIKGQVHASCRIVASKESQSHGNRWQLVK